MAQPALRMSYFSWKHTLRDRYCRLRYTNFVEMMMPCFSREALEKVLFTFDENETGWGTEAHWPRLLHAGPKDMAIVDEIGVVHARPIQPGRPLHRQEQEAYFRKYGLTDRVEEYSTLPADGAQNFPCSRERYGQFKAMFSHWLEVERMATASVGEDGHFGYAHFLFLLARITESQRLADAALDILGRAQDWLGNIKDDMSFGHGIAGCCWLVEFLARNGFIDCAPQDVLEEVNLHVERYLREHEDGLSFTELAGIGRYYLAKAARSGTAEHRRDCEHVAELLERKTDGGGGRGGHRDRGGRPGAAAKMWADGPYTAPPAGEAGGDLHVYAAGARAPDVPAIRPDGRRIFQSLRQGRTGAPSAPIAGPWRRAGLGGNVIFDSNGLIS